MLTRGITKRVLVAVRKGQQLLSHYDFETYSHCQKVAQISWFLGRVLGLDERIDTCLYLGGLIHDLGKIGMPLEILQKKGSLDEREWALVREHPGRGVALVAKLLPDRNLPEAQTVLNIVAYHHERPDGKGYPHGMLGKQIPLEARIVAIADALDAMLTTRPYRSKPKSWSQALDELELNAGTQFDPDIVRHAVKVMDGFSGIGRIVSCNPGYRI